MAGPLGGYLSDISDRLIRDWQIMVSAIVLVGIKSQENKCEFTERES